jgi:hypothetical protein
MTGFLVEAYMPATSDLIDLDARARLAATRLTEAGTEVRYMRAIFVPDDETCFLLFEAATSDAVHAASERAGLSAQRIVEAVGVTSDADLLRSQRG